MCWNGTCLTGCRLAYILVWKLNLKASELSNVSGETRGESKPERRSGKRIIAGTAFRLEFLVGWYYDADATMAVPELY